MTLLPILLVALVLVFAIVRPRGLPEIVIAGPAAVVVLLTGVVTLDEARDELASMAPTVVFLVAVLVVQPGTADAWRGIFANGFMKFVTFLFFLSLFYHAWIGIRDLWMDYIKPTGVRLSLHVLTIAVLIGYAGWASKILWSL